MEESILPGFTTPARGKKVITQRKRDYRRFNHYNLSRFTIDIFQLIQMGVNNIMGKMR